MSKYFTICRKEVEEYMLFDARDVFAASPFNIRKDLTSLYYELDQSICD
jgi:hypothetical protein